MEGGRNGGHRLLHRADLTHLREHLAGTGSSAPTTSSDISTFDDLDTDAHTTGGIPLVSSMIRYALMLEEGASLWLYAHLFLVTCGLP